MPTSNRREFLKLLTVGGAVFASGLQGCARGLRGEGGAGDDFFFVQLSDTHWGFKGPPNPEAESTLPQAIERVNALPVQPDFVVFTGDLTHTTDDVEERRRRLAGFKAHAQKLKTGKVWFLAGEHDAALDKGAAYVEAFGPLYQSFDHKGVHFVILDNVSDPAAQVGESQLDWLAKDLGALKPEQPIVVLTHRPLFDLFPQWDWTTKDGAKAIDILQHQKNVTVFYGHIHQEHHFKTGEIAHHAAKSLIFPLPPPGSQPKRAPIAWDPMHPGKGLGFRRVQAAAGGPLKVDEIEVEHAVAAAAEKA